jgi:predicted amidohydrolase YtcJ
MLKGKVDMHKLFESDRILFNGKIITVDPSNSIVEGLAIKDGKFLATGSTPEIMALAGDRTEIIDLDRKTVLPGLIDSHTHPSLAASQLTEINCRQSGVLSIGDIIQMVKDRAKELGPGKWVRGGNFNDSKLTEKRHITRRELDEAAPDNPVFILSDTGHQCLVNGKALELAGIDRFTPDPPGGKIDRDRSQEPTGLLYETATALASKVIPPYTVEELKEGFKTVLDQFSEWGITSTHDASGYNQAIRAYQQLLKEGFKKVRLNLMVSAFPREPEGVNLNESLTSLGIESGFGNDWLKVMTLKIMGDGSGAGGTAGVYDPQNRGPQGLGIMMTDPDIIEHLVLKAHQSGLRCSIHSIGDRGIDVALDCIEKAQRIKLIPDMRHRLEHNSCCTPKQLKRIKELGVAPSSSIGYMYGIGDQYYENFGPERSRWLHPHRTMQEMGIIAGGNNDCPVTFYGPFVQMYTAVTRKTISGKVIGPEEAISLMDAIRLYTWNGAYLAKEEDRLGSIEPGKLADLIVIDRDILNLPPEELLETKVLMTIVEGKNVYQC